jgi:LuxR family transcriptional regulator, maltose regulon positive regulatory protein
MNAVLPAFFISCLFCPVFIMSVNSIPILYNRSMKKTNERPYETEISPRLRRAFSESYTGYHVLLFSAPCGCGKTVCARRLLEGKKFCEWNAADPELFRKKIPGGCEAVLLDDLQYLTEQEKRDQLCTLIAERKDIHFILSGRCRLPGYLMAFKVSGNMHVFEMKDLLADRETAQHMLNSRGLRPDALEMTRIMKDSKGYFPALEMISRHMEPGNPYDDSVYLAAVRDIRLYLDENVFMRFEKPVRSLLLAIAPFADFTLELARIVSGNPDAGAVFAMLERDTSMMISKGRDQYCFQPIFRNMLLWENERIRTDAERKETLGRAAIYYELQGDLGNAMKYYAEAGERGKLIEILIRNAEGNPGVGHYRELQDYYDALSEEEIRKSPALMCTMSMLYAMRLDTDSSEKWYRELKKYVSGLKNKDPEYPEAAGKVVYLDIALPQRGSSGLIDVMRNTFRVLQDRKLKIPSFSVTSTLPSIMNGGKDFCEWSKKDTLLYRTMRKPVEALLGRDGVGLADCGICESRFEKGRNVSEEMLSLMSRLGEIQARGTPDIEFAVIGLLARIQVSLGKPQSAAESIHNLREKYEISGEKRFLPNMDAMFTRISLRTGDMEAVREWMKKAPGNEVHLWPMWRYQYLTRAMVQIGEGETDEAMLLLSRLIPYCESAGRIMDRLHIRILTAICRQRQKDASWKGEISAALDTSLEYGFIWPAAQYGAAILPLLRTCGWEKDREFLQELTEAARAQAVFYPKFLKERAISADPLSRTETQVLRLICQNLSNAEICEILDIRIPTVKTHVRNIFLKLNVRNRAEAKEAADKLHLLKE